MQYLVRTTITILCCVCLGMACVTELRLGLSGSEPSMANIHIQAFSVPLVCVSWRGAGSQRSYGWNPATLSSPSLSESTMGDLVKQYRPRNKVRYRAGDTLSLKRETLKAQQLKSKSDANFLLSAILFFTRDSFQSHTCYFPRKK